MTAPAHRLAIAAAHIGSELEVGLIVLWRVMSHR